MYVYHIPPDSLTILGLFVENKILHFSQRNIINYSQMSDSFVSVIRYIRYYSQILQDSQLLSH